MITVCLRKGVGQSAYGHGEEVEEALTDARQEFKHTFGGRPMYWAVTFSGGSTAGNFSNYRDLVTAAYKAMRVPEPPRGD